jgi:hypothetical protein
VSDTWRSTLKNCWVSSQLVQFPYVYTATVGLNGVFLSTLVTSAGIDPWPLCSIWKKKKEWPGKKSFLLVWIDGRRFSFQSKSQQPNTVRDSDTIRFPNFICKKYGTLCCNQFGMYYIHQWLLRWWYNVKAKKKEVDEHFLFFWLLLGLPPNGSIKSRHGPNLGVSRPWVNQVGGFYQGLSLLSHLNIIKKSF